mgnify:CR=1 FL=1
MAKILLLACQPKTASTFLANHLSLAGGGRTVSLVPGYDRREQEISEFRIMRYRPRWYPVVVAQHHIRYSEETGRLIKKYNLGVIVLTRDLFDAIASIRDHVRRESPVAPMMYLTSEMLAMSDSELEVFIAEFAIPWYLNFYMSWRRFEGATFISYSDVVRDLDGTVSEIFKKHGLRAATASKAPVKQAQVYRFNVGREGRGTEISPLAREIVVRKVERYTRFFQDSYLLSHLG